MTSLDEDNIHEKKQESFYYKSKESDVVYELSFDAAKLSGLFSVMIEQNRNENITKENAVALDVVYLQHTESTNQFTINTDRMLKYVDMYFKIWSENPSSANYVKETSIQTSDISTILKQSDLSLINNYLMDNITLIKEHKRSDYPDFSNWEFQNSENYKRSIKLQLLNELLSQVDEFLDIESFSNKIFAYIAAIICEVSLVNIDEGDVTLDNDKFNIEDEIHHIENVDRNADADNDADDNNTADDNDAAEMPTLETVD